MTSRGLCQPQPFCDSVFSDLASTKAEIEENLPSLTEEKKSTILVFLGCPKQLSPNRKINDSNYKI